MKAAESDSRHSAGDTVNKGPKPEKIAPVLVIADDEPSVDDEEIRSHVDDFIDQVLSEGELDIFDEERKDMTFALGITETEAIRRTSKPPFESVIGNLKKLQLYKRPIDKLRVIAQGNKQVVKSVNDFWQGVEGVKPKDLVLDVD
jgi:hypothetical protein